MAYADHSQSSSRTVAIVIVAIIHAVLGYAFVTGLGIQYVKKAAQQLNVIDVADEPPPPEEPPPPPPPQKEVPPPPVYIPPPQVALPAPAPVIMSTPTLPPPLPPAPTAPPAPPAPVISKAAGAKGNPANWITTDDYPSRALRDGAHGTSYIQWDINEQGRVENCRILSSSGNSDLDETACNLITRRGRYQPALDQHGNPIRSSDRRRVVWKLPSDY